MKYKVLMFLIIILILFNDSLISNYHDTKNTSSINSKSFDLRTKLAKTASSITSNSDFRYRAQLNNWPGNGSINNPIVIENEVIDTSEYYSSIIIKNTNLYFIIRNCTFNVRSNWAIFLENVENGLISNNSFSISYYYTIDLRNSNNINITNNTFESFGDNSQSRGDLRFEYSFEINVNSNNFSYSSIRLFDSYNNSFIYNRFINSFLNFDNSSYNYIKANYLNITDSKVNQYGIEFTLSNQTKLRDNIIESKGIKIDSSIYNDFVNNKLYKGKLNILSNTINNILQGKFINNSFDDSPIIMYQNKQDILLSNSTKHVILINSNNITISNSSFQSFVKTHLDIFSSSKINILSNTFESADILLDRVLNSNIEDNYFNNLHLQLNYALSSIIQNNTNKINGNITLYDSNYNLLSNNNLNSCEVSLINSMSNSFSYNTIKNTPQAFSLVSNSNFNILTNNYIENSTIAGISTSRETYDNELYSNSIKNTSIAFDISNAFRIENNIAENNEIGFKITRYHYSTTIGYKNYTNLIGNIALHNNKGFDINAYSLINVKNNNLSLNNDGLIGEGILHLVNNTSSNNKNVGYDLELQLGSSLSNNNASNNTVGFMIDSIQNSNYYTEGNVIIFSNEAIENTNEGFLFLTTYVLSDIGKNSAIENHDGFLFKSSTKANFYNNIAEKNYNGFLLEGRFDKTYMGNISNNVFTSNVNGFLFKNEYPKYSAFLGKMYDVKLVNNSFINNSYGFYAEHLVCSLFYKNEFIENGYGLYFSNSQYGDIINNVFIKNRNYGAYFDQLSFNNIIGLNIFESNNGINKQSANYNSTNYYSMNYWSDHVSPDSDNDYIVDNPYRIDGNKLFDENPVTTKSIYEIPIIMIDKPTNVTNAKYTFYNQVTLYWKVFSQYPSHYVIYRNNEQIVNKSWEIGEIIQYGQRFDLPDKYEFKIIFYDKLGNTLTDTVMISFKSSSSSPSTGNYKPPQYTLFYKTSSVKVDGFMIGIFVVGIIFIVYKKRRKEK